MAIVKTSAERTAELEAQLAALEADAADQAADPLNTPDGNLTPEEKTFKKRYADLRSYSSRVENDLRAQLAAKDAALLAATKKEMDFPKTQDEVAAWAAKYPEIYDTIVTIARQNAIDVQKDVQEKVQQFEAREYEYSKEVAYGKLVAAHPDFPDIASSQDFIDWTESQPKYIHDALYVNETDADSAIRAVDLYKADRGLTSTPKSAKKDPDTRDAARQVPKGQNTVVNHGDAPKWTESKLAGVNWNRLTEAQLQEIEEASLNPAFYDISGGAR